MAEIEPFEQKKQFSMRSFIEFILSLFLACLLLIVAFILFVFYNPFKTQTKPSPEDIATDQVLGILEEKEPVVQQIIINPKEEVKIDKITFEDALVSDNLVLFDNVNKSYLEGQTQPESKIKVTIGQEILDLRSDTEGYFQIPIPLTTTQFTSVHIETLGEDAEIVNQINFVLILRRYQDRTYFIHEKYNEVFSIKTDSTYKTLTGDYDQLASISCSASFSGEINENNYNSTTQADIVIFPTDIDELYFEKNKFVSFEIKSISAVKTQDDCINEWKIFHTSLNWHTDLIKALTELRNS